MTKKDREIIEARKIYIVVPHFPEATLETPPDGKAKSAWLLAQAKKNLEDVIRFIELEIQPNFPVKITQVLNGINTLFVKAETDEASAELFKIPGCHVSRNEEEFVALQHKESSEPDNNFLPDAPTP